MKPVLNLLLPAICILIYCTGCKKDSDSSSSSYLRGKVDGVAFECNSDIRATTGGAGDKTIFFRGDWPSYSIRFFLDGQGSDITAGSYNFQTGIKCNAVLYQNNDGYSAGYFCDPFSACVFYGSGRITILQINKKHIKGTFEFVTSINGATGNLKNITDGDFSIKRD